jgi:hypothetical protein
LKYQTAKKTNNRTIEMFTKILFVLLLASIEQARSQSFTGDVTFYHEWRGNFGSCALDRSRWDHFHVVALSRFFMALPPGVTNPNNHPMCASHRCIQVFGARGSVVLKISDTCWGCANHDIDVADSVFPMLDDPNRGRVRMNWQFVDCRTSPPGPR